MVATFFRLQCLEMLRARVQGMMFRVKGLGQSPL